MALKRGLRGGVMENTNKAATYLMARQWLEWYADTHAEISPMHGEAYLLAGRKASTMPTTRWALWRDTG